MSDPEFKVDSTFKGFGSRRGPFKPIESLEIDRDFTNFLSGKSDKIYGVYKDGTRTDVSLGDSSKLTLYPSIEATVLDTRSDSNVSGWTLSYSGTATVFDKDGQERQVSSGLVLGSADVITQTNARDGGEFIKHEKKGSTTNLYREPGSLYQPLRVTAGQKDKLQYGRYEVELDGERHTILEALTNEESTINKNTNGKGSTEAVTSLTESTLNLKDESGLGFDDGDRIVLDSTWTLTAKP